MPKIAVYSGDYLNKSEIFIQRQVLGVAKHCDVVVITNRVINQDSYRGEKIRVVQRTLWDQIRVVLAKKLFNKRGWIPLSLSERYKVALEEEGVALVHAHFGPAGLEISSVTREMGIPLVVTFHGWDASSLLRSEAASRAICELGQTAYFICVSKAVMQKLIKIGVTDSRMMIHYIGVPLSDFKYFPREPSDQDGRHSPTFLHVGRMVEKKGVEYTLRAFRHYLNDYPGARMKIIGEGPLLEEMTKRSQALGLDAAVEFLGGRPNSEVRTMLAQADVFVLHSITAPDGDEEGLPIVLMEAMATGCPVVSTYHSGIPELIEDGESGYLVDEKDISAYAAAMRNAAVAGRDVARKARAIIELKFSAEIQNEVLSAHYFKILEQSKTEKLIRRR